MSQKQGKGFNKRKGVVSTVSIVIVLFFLLASMMVIYYKLSNTVDLTDNIVSVTNAMNTGVVNPELVLNAGCITRQRGVIEAQSFVENRCGLDCIRSARGLEVTLQSSHLDKSCTSNQQSGDWTQQNTYWVTVVNKTSGRSYPAQLKVRS